MTISAATGLNRLPAELELNVSEVVSGCGSFPEKWIKVVALLKASRAPPALYRQLWDACLEKQVSDATGAPAMWFPTDFEVSSSNPKKWMASLGIEDFTSFHRWTVEHRIEFWRQSLDRLSIKFHRQPDSICDESSGVESPRWLDHAEFNIADSCFQAPRPETAIIFCRPGDEIQKWTFDDLLTRTRKIATAIRAAGFKPGDALAVVLPMTAESVAIYLGIVWSGCVVVSIADSFAPAEIANRLRIANAVAVFTYDQQVRAGKTLPLYDRVVEATSLPIITLTQCAELAVKLRPQDIAWNKFLVGPRSKDTAAFVATAETPINILFSSGTTGDPKAIPWTHSTPIKCAIDGHCHQDIRPGHVVAWPTNLGWMMGPWLIFAALLNRATIAIYEDAPMGAGFGKFVQDARVNMLGVVPTIVKAWRNTACMEPFDWSAIHVFSSTGESSQRDDMFYLSSLAGMRPVIEYCGGTEIGGAFITSTVVQPNTPAAFTTPAVGLDWVILDEEQQLADEGELFLVPPSMGLSQRLLNRDHYETYYADTPRLPNYPFLRRHGDYFRRLPGGVYVAGGRVDDTMNLGGIKISSAELERVMNRIDGVRETAAIACTIGGGPEELVVFAVLDKQLEELDLLKSINTRLKLDLNPLFRAREVHLVDSLPRTASNKVMRRRLRDLLGAKS